MLSKVFVLSQTDYDNWKKSGSSEEPESSDSGNEKDMEEMN
jgi:hypothetical protein